MYLVRVLTVATVTAATGPSNAVPCMGCASADYYIHQYMHESELNFQCTAYFLREKQFSDHELCTRINERVRWLLLQKKIAETPAEIEKLRLKVLDNWKQQLFDLGTSP
jgi:hypothetical protein